MSFMPEFGIDSGKTMGQFLTDLANEALDFAKDKLDDIHIDPPLQQVPTGSVKAVDIGLIGVGVIAIIVVMILKK